jgi:hypothetical protein
VTRPARMRWVAHPPPGAYRRGGGSRPARPYLGPPRYPAPPRWGFPSLAWRWPRAVPGTVADPVSPVERVRALARHTSGMLWLFAALAVLAAGAEGWRYVLLLRSRFGALSDGVVSTSDTFVYASAGLALAVGALAAGMTLWWVYVARDAAAEVAGYESPRSTRGFFFGMLIPFVNLAVAGSVFAELEHAAQRGEQNTRPRPSRLVRWWWLTWAVNGLVTAVTILWRLRGGVQAQADGVVLSVVTDLLGAAVAVLTVLLLRRLVLLLAPIDLSTVRLMRVVGVSGAPEPPLRATRAWGSTR